MLKLVFQSHCEHNKPTEENQILVTDCTILFHLFNLSLKYNSDKSSKQKPRMACVSVSFYLPLPLGSSSALCCHVKHQLESILHQYEFPSSSFCCHLKNVKCWNCLKHVWAACREKPALQKWFHLKRENNPSAEKEAAMTAWLYVSCWPPLISLISPQPRTHAHTHTRTHAHAHTHTHTHTHTRTHTHAHTHTDAGLYHVVCVFTCCCSVLLCDEPVYRLTVCDEGAQML